MTMIMIMVMTMIMIMIMTMTMVSYHHHEAPRAVRGSVGGCSMDMWCPHGIVRESWGRVVPGLVDQAPLPPGGEVALGCSASRALVGAGRPALEWLLNC